MPIATAKDKFYGPLRKVARQYLPMLMARLKVLEKRSAGAMEFLEAEADEARELVWIDGVDRIACIAEAQTDLHKAVLEAGTCQQLVGAFIELLQEDYTKIRDSNCYFVGPEGEMISLYSDQVDDQEPPSESPAVS